MKWFNVVHVGADYISARVGGLIMLGAKTRFGFGNIGMVHG
ncbi:hypothetical protein [Neisseria zalophi]|nr:hypothetical protein [Neisseria zalophi]